MSSRTSTKVATDPPRQQPSSAFVRYLLDRLRRRNPKYQCYIPPRPYFDPKKTPEDPHICINLHDVDIFSHAQAFDEDPESKGKWSTWATNILALVVFLLMIPVLPVVGLVYTVSGLFKDTFHLPTKRQDGSDTGFRPYRWSRRMAIWIVYVPLTKLAGIGGLTAIVLPSLRPRFKHTYKDAVMTGRKRRESRLRAKTNLEKLASILYNTSLNEEYRALHEAANPGHLATPNDVKANLEVFMARAKNTRAIKSFLMDVKAELREIEDIAATEGCMEQTGYKGIADWANDAWKAYENLVNAMTVLCGLGAGLAYTSIFSANRGNVGYMCWAFSLFIIGLVLTTTTQALLTWCSRLEEYPFSTPSLWELVIGIGVYGAVGVVIAAICLLMLSVQQLNYAAPVVVTTDPRPPAYFAFSTLGTGLFIAVLVFALFCGANGAKKLLWRRSLDRLKAPKRGLEDYPEFTEPTLDAGKPKIDDLVDIV
ncbi:hypothetical protein BS47DRAFT_1483842 [Hydnum rufescens UP504]|uniref:Uncharacterized protein n=1 Tax=Hydnum rufescens UP504 TaxID=1448309 RepID=A0A9P6B350_9AGAM|nr:hypothetical protein BS47DRAFT_1483842 [Hydnum rufescens UP504]